MGIQSGDIVLLASQVMDDVDEGGGAPTGNIIPNGTSNSVFPDISESDRAIGRVRMRKVFPAIQTNDREMYLGANFILAMPPQDPLVSITLFSTDDFFDRRVDAAARIASYLSRGVSYAGYLFGDHIAGQRTVTLLQREEIADPVVGGTLVLRKNEGLGTQFDQYIRITGVSVLVRTFSDAQSASQGDFKRKQVTLSISDALQQDFNGFDAMRSDASINYTGKTKTFETIVANAADYFGASRLDEDASIGDFGLKVASIYTQLVPSTRIEVPVADARLNQARAVGVDTGSTPAFNLDTVFTTAQNLFIGGSILPGSLSITRSGITLLDKGGALQQAGVTVGAIDYANGLATLATNVFGTGSGTHTVTYTAAAQPTLVTETMAIKVTQEGQRLNWIISLDPVPARGTLQVSYRTLGKWVTLTDDGSGALRGADSSAGAGTLNFTTGTVSLTLGSLPDVASRILLNWANDASTSPVATGPTSALDSARKVYRLINIPHVIKPGSITLTWNDGVARTATDSGGQLTGDATGKVYYGFGQIHFAPNNLPAKNTVVTATVNEAVQHQDPIASFTDGGASWTFSLGGAVVARSVELSVVASLPMRQFPGNDVTNTFLLHVFDDGGGNLKITGADGDINAGTINYGTGACSLLKSVTGYKTVQPTFAVVAPLSSAGDPSSFVKQTGTEVRTQALAIANGGATLPVPVWGWWTGSQTQAAWTQFGGVDGATAQAYPVTLDYMSIDPQFKTNTVTPDGWQSQMSYPTPTEFGVGSDRYVFKNSSGGGSGYNLVQNPTPATGEGTLAGSYVAATGQPVFITSWSAGASSTPTYFAGVNGAPVSGPGTAQLVDSATLRTAISPLLNGGFTINGIWIDGTTFSATADNAGKISTGSAAVGATPGSYGVFGVVDYETGIADLRFGRRMPVDFVGGIDVSELGLAGITRLESRGVQSDSLRYNAVGFSYLPLNPDLLGLDPVRLPSDGRVPIFRSGDTVVVGHTHTRAAATYANGASVNLGRTRLSRARVVDADGLVIDTGYTINLDTGILSVVDVSTWDQPVTIEDRVEDLVQVSDVQLNGQLTFTRQLTHAFPADETVVSSAIMVGDRRARVSTMFDQQTWTGVWSDSVIGSPADATFNDVQYPLVVTNKSTVKERWRVQFTSTTAFTVTGEHVGVVAVGAIGTDCSPNNPSTGQPYFMIPSAGWGLGWSAGNVLRFNTESATFPVWEVMTVLQGPETFLDHRYSTLTRGGVDRP